jgi:hypothetical protein
MNTTTEEPTQDNLFLSTLQRHRGGRLLAQASEQLRQVVAAVHETGKPGTVTITLNVKAAQRGQSAVVVTDKCVQRAPAIEPEASFWYATPAGELCKEDPRQLAFRMGVVAGGKASEAINTAVPVQIGASVA